MVYYAVSEKEYDWQFIDFKIQRKGSDPVASYKM